MTFTNEAEFEKALIKAGLTQKEAKEAAEYAKKNRGEYGVLPGKPTKPVIRNF